MFLSALRSARRERIPDFQLYIDTDIICIYTLGQYNTHLLCLHSFFCLRMYINIMYNDRILYKLVIGGRLELNNGNKFGAHLDGPSA